VLYSPRSFPTPHPFLHTLRLKGENSNYGQLQADLF
jgi:hypothetical protein